MKTRKIVIFGGSGLAGFATKELLSKEFQVYAPTSKECNLINKEITDSYLKKIKPDLVINCAGLVGGILFNYRESTSFLTQNLDIGINVAKSCIENNIPDYIYFGSNCIYPKESTIPITEDQILSGKLEITNRSYALSKIVSIQLISTINEKYKKNYFSVMPPNLYGDNDIFHLDKSHVLQCLIMKIHEAKINNKNEVTIWGTGTPKREFLHTRDLAEGVKVLIEKKEQVFSIIKKQDLPIINIGTGIDIEITELARTIASVIGWNGKFIFDKSKPDGTKRKLLDIQKINSLGWKSKIGLENGITDLYQQFINGDCRK
jgi:GDP-L-fucose synthase